MFDFPIKAILRDGELMPNPYPPRQICQFPTELLNARFELELDPGDVWMSMICHRHIALDHPIEYADCFPSIQDVIESPNFVGRSPKHNDAIEIIKRLLIDDVWRIVLAPVSITPNKQGNYHLHSFYEISQEDIDYRRRLNRISQVI